MPARSSSSRRARRSRPPSPRDCWPGATASSARYSWGGPLGCIRSNVSSSTLKFCVYSRQTVNSRSSYSGIAGTPVGALENHTATASSRSVVWTVPCSIAWSTKSWKLAGMICRRSTGSGTSHSVIGNGWNASAITWARTLPSTGSARRIGGSIMQPSPGPLVLVRRVTVRRVLVRRVPVRRVPVGRVRVDGLDLGDGPLAQADRLVVTRSGDPQDQRPEDADDGDRPVRERELPAQVGLRVDAEEAVEVDQRIVDDHAERGGREDRGDQPGPCVLPAPVAAEEEDHRQRREGDQEQDAEATGGAQPEEQLDQRVPALD